MTDAVGYKIEFEVYGDDIDANAASVIIKKANEELAPYGCRIEPTTWWRGVRYRLVKLESRGAGA